MFLDRVDLAGAWIRSGRPKESFSDADLTVMDLRMLVRLPPLLTLRIGEVRHMPCATCRVPRAMCEMPLLSFRRQVSQMETDVAYWPALRFYPPSRTVTLLDREEAQQAADKRAADPDDPPPALL